jgi:tol-pal system protein YbgF
MLLPMEAGGSMRARRPHEALLAVCAALACGCATTPSASDAAPATDAREVDVLRERVGRLERRLSDVDARLAVLLEAAARRPPAARTTTAAATPPEEPPPDATRTIELPRAQPTEPAREDDVILGGVEDDGAEPIVIRMEGDAAPRFDGDSSSSSSAQKGDAKAIYDWAMERRKAGEHLEAIAAFEDVQQRFPTHDLADNAMYWAGACHDERGDRRLAIAVWQKLPLKHPKSPKVPDALFGMAQAHEALGEPAIAEALYQELVRSYPKAERAPEAKRALARLRPR